jgi:L-rhamnose isomerase
MKSSQVEKRYQIASETYADLGVDTESVLRVLPSVALSIHCWQGDDVGGFEAIDTGALGGGLAATGGYPGKARTL